MRLKLFRMKKSLFIIFAIADSNFYVLEFKGDFKLLKKFNKSIKQVLIDWDTVSLDGLHSNVMSMQNLEKTQPYSLKSKITSDPSECNELKLLQRSTVGSAALNAEKENLIESKRGTVALDTTTSIKQDLEEPRNSTKEDDVYTAISNLKNSEEKLNFSLHILYNSKIYTFKDIFKNYKNINFIKEYENETYKNIKISQMYIFKNTLNAIKNDYLLKIGYKVIKVPEEISKIYHLQTNVCYYTNSGKNGTIYINGGFDKTIISERITSMVVNNLFIISTCNGKIVAYKKWKNCIFQKSIKVSNHWHEFFKK